MRSLSVICGIVVAFFSVTSVAQVRTWQSRSDIVVVDQIDDELAHESDSDLIFDYILAYSVDFDVGIQDQLKSGQITADQARSMKEQFHAPGTGFADQMREMFDAEYSNKHLPFEERLRAYLRKSIKSLWEDKKLAP